MTLRVRPGGLLSVTCALMSQKRSDKNRRRQQRKRAQERRGRRQEAEAGELDLMVSIDHALAERHPMALLEVVSGIVSALDVRRQNPFAPTEGPVAAVGDLVSSFMEVDLPATTGALHALALLAADELAALRIQREVSGRRHVLPAWLSCLGDIEVYRAVEMSHVLGDGDDVIVGARWPDGQELSALVYVDHNLGTVVKDAFVVDQPIAELVALIQRTATDPGTTFADLDLAEAGAKIAEPIEAGLRLWPPLESDTWPMCRPLVEWLVRSMPAGGSGWQRREWTEEERQQLADDFFSSPYGAELDDPERRSLLEPLLWFGTDYANGDPLRWSNVSVELLLADWIPRKIVAEATHLTGVPDLLRAFIAYAHDRAEISPELTEHALATIDEYEPAYQQAIRSPRLQGPEALLAAAGLLSRELDEDVGSYEDIMLNSLARAVGGRETLDALDDQPLADEPFDWSRLPDDIHGRVAEVLALVDTCCEELLDTEYRTACRRLLADVAAGDPAIFRRAAAARTAAAAVCWIIGKANSVFGLWGTGLEVQDLLAHFEVRGSVSQRAQTMLKACGIDPYQYGGMDLGSPRYLVSESRATLIARRDQYAGPV